MWFNFYFFIVLLDQEAHMSIQKKKVIRKIIRGYSHWYFVFLTNFRLMISVSLIKSRNRDKDNSIFHRLIAILFQNEIIS